MSATHKPELAVTGLERPGAKWTLPTGPRARYRLAGLRLAARCRGLSLDRRLAAGESSADGALAARARMITERRSQRRLAAGLERALRDSQHPSSGFSSAAPPDRREVLAARTVIEALIGRLRATPGGPVRPQGVAMLGLLLSDAASPLYRMAEPGSLGSDLRAVAAALEPSNADGLTL